MYEGIHSDKYHHNDRNNLPVMEERQNANSNHGNLKRHAQIALAVVARFGGFARYGVRTGKFPAISQPRSRFACGPNRWVANPGPPLLFAASRSDYLHGVPAARVQRDLLDQSALVVSADDTAVFCFGRDASTTCLTAEFLDGAYACQKPPLRAKQ